MRYKQFKKVLLLLLAPLALGACDNYDKNVGNTLQPDETAGDDAVKVYMKNELYPYSSLDKSLTYVIVDEMFEEEDANLISIPIYTTEPVKSSFQVKLVYNNERADEYKSAQNKILIEESLVDFSSNTVTLEAGRTEATTTVKVNFPTEVEEGTYVLPLKIELSGANPEEATLANKFSTMDVAFQVTKSYKGAISVANELPAGLKQIILGPNENFRGGFYGVAQPSLTDGDYTTGMFEGKYYGFSLYNINKKVRAIGFAPMVDRSKAGKFLPFITKIRQLNLHLEGAGGFAPFGEYEFDPITGTDIQNPEVRYIVFKTLMPIQNIKLDLGYENWMDQFGISEVILYE